MGNFFNTTEKLRFQTRQFCEPKEISTHKQNKIGLFETDHFDYIARGSIFLFFLSAFNFARVK